jgi:hypothetical protein
VQKLLMKNALRTTAIIMGSWAAYRLLKGW